MRKSSPLALVVNGHPYAGKTTLRDALTAELRSQGLGVDTLDTETGYDCPKSPRDEASALKALSKLTLKLPQMLGSANLDVLVIEGSFSDDKRRVLLWNAVRRQGARLRILTLQCTADSELRRRYALRVEAAKKDGRYVTDLHVAFRRRNSLAQSPWGELHEYIDSSAQGVLQGALEICTRSAGWHVYLERSALASQSRSELSQSHIAGTFGERALLGTDSLVFAETVWALDLEETDGYSTRLRKEIQNAACTQFGAEHLGVLSLDSKVRAGIAFDALRLTATRMTDRTRPGALPLDVARIGEQPPVLVSSTEDEYSRYEDDLERIAAANAKRVAKDIESPLYLLAGALTASDRATTIYRRLRKHAVFKNDKLSAWRAFHRLFRAQHHLLAAKTNGLTYRPSSHRLSFLAYMSGYDLSEPDLFYRALQLREPFRLLLGMELTPPSGPQFPLGLLIRESRRLGTAPEVDEVRRCVWDEDQRAVAAATILSSAADDVESSTWNWWRKRVGELRSLAEEHSNASNELTRSEPHVPDASERVPADWLESLGMLFDMEWTRSALRYLRARPRLLALLLLLLFALSFLAKEFIGSRLQGVFEESALSADSVASAP